MMRRIVLIVAVLSVACAVGAAGKGRRETLSPFACNMGAFTPKERAEYTQLSARFKNAVIAQREKRDGYAFAVNHAQMSAVDLARWAQLERQCCPFFDFTIEMRRENGPLSLTLTGREGVKAFIRSEMGVR